MYHFHVNQTLKDGSTDAFKAKGLKGQLALHSSRFATGCSEESLGGGNQVLIFF